MGWKLSSDMDSLSKYSLYVFSRLTAPLCLSEFKRQSLRAMEDHAKTVSKYGTHSSIKDRIYADFLFLILIFTGVGWALGVVLTMLVYSLTHDWNACGGRHWIFNCWKVKLYGATKPLGRR